MTFAIHYFSKLSLTFFRLSVVSGNKNHNLFYYDKIPGEEINRSKIFKRCLWSSLNVIKTKLYKRIKINM